MEAEKLDLKKEVYNKTQYSRTIDTSFNEFGITPVSEILDEQVSVEEFFGLYNSLFYDIPALGNNNSHEYLVKTSGTYINFNQDNEEIEALRAEIAQLRADLLEAQIGNITNEIPVNNDNNDGREQLEAIQQELRTSQEDLINQTTQVSNSNLTSMSDE
jgi:hypothetical protein